MLPKSTISADNRFSKVKLFSCFDETEFLGIFGGNAIDEALKTGNGAIGRMTALSLAVSVSSP